MNKRTYTLGNQTFTTKAAAETHLREMLHHYLLGSRVEGDDHALLASILPNHPEAKEKVGSGVSHFEVHNSEYGTTCFFVVRTDGTKMPFSFRSCIKPDSTQGTDMTLATITQTALTNLAKCNVQLALVNHLPKAQKFGDDPPDWTAAKLILESHKGLLYHHLGLNIGMVYLFPTQDGATVDQLHVASVTLSANIVDMRTTQQTPLPNEWHPKSLKKRFGEKYLVAADMPQLFNHLICRGAVVLCETTEQLQAQLQSIRFPFYPLTPNQPLEPRWLSYHLRVATMYELALIADDGSERGRLETIVHTIDDCYEASDERGMIAAFKGVFTPAQDW